MVDLTVVILTKNEEGNLKKCIESFNGIVKRFVIVDSWSTDGTKGLCEKLKKSINIDFYENKFIDYATQLNWGLDNTNITTKWTMRMDADEELTPELADEINQRLEILDNNISGIILKRRMYFMGKWIKHGGVYPTKLLRIFRTGKSFCELKIMDEHMVLVEGESIEFKNDFMDFNVKDLDWWIHKHNWYSNREVLDYHQSVVINDMNKKEIAEDIKKGQAERKRFVKNKGYYKLPLFLRTWLYFVYRYYIRLGFLDGKEGRIYHFLQAYWYRFLVDAKIYECENKGKVIIEQGDLK